MEINPCYYDGRRSNALYTINIGRIHNTSISPVQAIKKRWWTDTPLNSNQGDGSVSSNSVAKDKRNPKYPNIYGPIAKALGLKANEFFDTPFQEMKRTKKRKNLLRYIEIILKRSNCNELLYR